MNYIGLGLVTLKECVCVGGGPKNMFNRTKYWNLIPYLPLEALPRWEEGAIQHVSVLPYCKLQT